jgi:hypothetical protein
MTDKPTSAQWFSPAPPATRQGGWIQTRTGRKFWPLDPRPEDVHIEDIAHALAMKCRYGGHCLRFYSVAEHSVLVSQFLPPELALWGLLHDAGEAYLADVPRPVKQQLTGFHALEAAVLRAVAVRFGLQGVVEPPEVKRIDTALLSDERKVLMAPLLDGAASDAEWGATEPGVGAHVRGLDPVAAAELFLQRFAELTQVR